MGLLATALVCTALMSGCPQARAESGKALPPVEAFAISYERGGGLAPSFAKLTVAPGRRATASIGGGRAGDRTAHFTIGAARVRGLQRALARARFGTLKTTPPGGCADCFVYGIDYRGHSVSFDDATEPPQLKGVVDQLESVIGAHTIPPEA